MDRLLPKIYTIQNDITIIQWDKVRIYICPEVIVLRYGDHGERIFRRWFKK